MAPPEGRKDRGPIAGRGFAAAGFGGSAPPFLVPAPPPPPPPGDRPTGRRRPTPSGASGWRPLRRRRWVSGGAGAGGMARRNPGEAAAKGVGHPLAAEGMTGGRPPRTAGPPSPPPRRPKPSEGGRKRTHQPLRPPYPKPTPVGDPSRRRRMGERCPRNSANSPLLSPKGTPWRSSRTQKGGSREGRGGGDCLIKAPDSANGTAGSIGSDTCPSVSHREGRRWTVCPPGGVGFAGGSGPRRDRRGRAGGRGGSGGAFLGPPRGPPAAGLRRPRRRRRPRRSRKRRLYK